MEADPWQGRRNTQSEDGAELDLSPPDFFRQ